jgi:DNA-binding winged helix-turn-helix (wHTH) protein
MTGLSPTERRVYEFLAGKAGEIVPIQAFGEVISVKDRGYTNLRVVMSKLRRKGIDIETIFGKGYRLKAKKKMPVIELDYDTQVYAQEIEATVRTTMGNHAETVGFESQIAIIGVVIGAMLEQLPDRDKKHFTNILIENVKNAKKYSVPMQMQ